MPCRTPHTSSYNWPTAVMKTRRSIRTRLDVTSIYVRGVLRGDDSAALTPVLPISNHANNVEGVVALSLLAICNSTQSTLAVFIIGRSCSLGKARHAGIIRRIDRFGYLYDESPRTDFVKADNGPEPSLCSLMSSLYQVRSLFNLRLDRHH